MGKIEPIEHRIAARTPEKLAIFRHWFTAFDADAWDRQIEADAEAGKLESIVAEARADYDAGKARER